MSESDAIYATVGQDTPRKVHESWYRGPVCNHFASKANLAEPDAIASHILPGCAPDSPIIQQRSHITAIGSCFAQYVRDELARRGFMVSGAQPDGRQVTPRFLQEQSAYVIICGPGLNNTDVIRQQFEWAWTGDYDTAGAWFDEDHKLRLPEPEIRDATKAIFNRTDVYILTLGLSEAWYLKRNGSCCWRAIPESMYHPDLYGFKVLSVKENVSNLMRIVHLISHFRPEAQMILTLSPVPLMATFRPMSCIVANAASKATLRAAIDEVMREELPKVHYFPSYEIVQQLYGPAAYTEGNRHVTDAVIRRIMDAFVAHYCVGGRP